MRSKKVECDPSLHVGNEAGNLSVTLSLKFSLPSNSGELMLSDTKIKAIKPAERDYKIVDDRGLQLLVRVSGSKLWQVRYRFEGKEKVASLGAYPEVGLAQARGARDSLRKLLASGQNPTEVKRSQKLARLVIADQTFEKIAVQWFEWWSPSKNQRHAEYVKRRLASDVFPQIGKRPIVDIQPIELVSLVKRIEKRGALDIAKRAYQTCGQIFRYAVVHGMVSKNPCADIKPSDVLKIQKQTNFARIDAKELPELLRKIEAYQGTALTRMAIKLMAHTFVRTSELIGARWDEIDFESAEWRLPPNRMKMKAPHIVPLSRQALEVLRVLHHISGTSQLLFPGERDHEKPMSNNTILMALDRMGYKGRMTGHGFRGIASTVLHEEGFDHQHIELQLAHQERNRVSSAYNHALYLKPRTEMMQWWSEYLDRCVSKNVIPMTAKRA